MTRYAWAYSTPSVHGKLLADELDHIQILLGNQYGDVGDEEAELNSLSYYKDATIDIDGNPTDVKRTYYNWRRTTSRLFYKPPTDMSAGFYNVTLRVNSSRGNGVARMFADKNSYLDGNYPGSTNDVQGYTKGNFLASLSGTVFTTCYYPTITTLSQSQGSAAGGLTLTISGNGFHNEVSKNKVCFIPTACVLSYLCVSLLKAPYLLQPDHLLHFTYLIPLSIS